MLNHSKISSNFCNDFTYTSSFILKVHKNLLNFFEFIKFIKEDIFRN